MDISKSGHLFAHHPHIETAAATIFEQLATENYLAGLDPGLFTERAAHYLAELNALHPFREGKGRAQREFISHLARAHGYYIAWENVTRHDMLQASIRRSRATRPNSPRSNAIIFRRSDLTLSLSKGSPADS